MRVAVQHCVGGAAALVLQRARPSGLIMWLCNLRILRKLPRHRSVEWIERLLLAVTDIRNRKMIVLSCGAGLRMSEIVGGKVSDIGADGSLLPISTVEGRDQVHAARAGESWSKARGATGLASI